MHIIEFRSSQMPTDSPYRWPYIILGHKRNEAADVSVNLGPLNVCAETWWPFPTRGLKGGTADMKAGPPTSVQKLDDRLCSQVKKWSCGHKASLKFVSAKLVVAGDYGGTWVKYCMWILWLLTCTSVYRLTIPTLQLNKDTTAIMIYIDAANLQFPLCILCMRFW